MTGVTLLSSSGEFSRELITFVLLGADPASQLTCSTMSVIEAVFGEISSIGHSAQDQLHNYSATPCVGGSPCELQTTGSPFMRQSDSIKTESMDSARAFIWP